MSKPVTAIKRHRTARLAKVLTRSIYLHGRKKDNEIYDLICDEFVHLGGVYVKFLQGVLLRSSVFKKWHSPRKLDIFEDLHSEPLDIAKILQTELPKDKLKQIKSIQPQSFAAGSFGQVYYGEHINGKPIIIKVLRPMVRELLRYDLKLLGVFTRGFMGRFKGNIDMNINSAIQDFSESTLKETDYIAEAEFAAEFYNAYKNSPDFIVPETFLDLCTTNIIVQEYIGGVSVAYVVKLQDQGVEPKSYVKEQLGSDLDKQLITLGTEFLRGAFSLPRIQGDPHPGNIKLLPDNKIGIIDFGISAQAPENMAAFYGLLKEWHYLLKDSTSSISSLFEQFIRFFVSDLYRALKRLSTFAKQADKSNDFTREVGRIAQDTFRQITGTKDIEPLLSDGRFLQIINQIVNKDNRFGLVIKLESSQILRAATTYVTLVETLGRRGTVLPAVFEAVIAEISEKFPELEHQQDPGMSVADALHVVSSWLERVAERDPALFIELNNSIKLSGAKSNPAQVLAQAAAGVGVVPSTTDETLKTNGG